MFILIARHNEFYLYLSEVHSVASSMQTPSSPAHGVTCPNKAVGTKSQHCNCSIIHTGKAAENACPKAKTPPLDYLAAG
jgi:hypothetical protein